jgi:hypothetical protein
MLVNDLTERFGTMATRQDARQAWHEGLMTGGAKVSPGMDHQVGGLTEAIEMANLAQIAALAVQPGTPAVGTPPRPRRGLGLDMDG